LIRYCTRVIFFFQAEDGIRDFHVTGVQTCALPISWAFPYTLISCANADKKRLKVDLLAAFPVAACQAALALPTLCLSCSIAARKIGRASCRETPEDWVSVLK